jgi:hypothetical protein
MLSMRQIIRVNKESELTRTLDDERLKLEMLGVGIDISAFISSLYEQYKGKMDVGAINNAVKNIRALIGGAPIKAVETVLEYTLIGEYDEAAAMTSRLLTGVKQ